MPDTRNTIIRLLQNIGSRKEVDQYLKQFASIDSKKFAVIKVGGGILQDELETLASSLTFLHRVGLYPIVIHGAGPQLNAALEEAGIETERIDGMRVTPPATLEVARKVFQNETLRLVEALEKMGTHARPITNGVIEAKLLDVERYGLVGEITAIHTELIESSIRSGALPILGCLGETPTGQIVNINADVAARELAIAIEPFKIVFLTPTGGLLNQHNQLIDSINLAEDYEFLMQQDWVHSGMRLKLQEIKQLLDKLPLESSVSITTPGQLARELFTHRGSGTLVRRGEEVVCHTVMDKVDKDRLRELLEACFGRKLMADYFDSKPFHRIYLTESYRATAVITLEGGIPYLDKFGVTQKAQGEGLGQSMWQRMKQENPRLFWRARTENPINSWYFQEAEGTYRSGAWTVFWYGLSGFDEIQQCVEIALNMPATLHAHAVSEN